MAGLPQQKCTQKNSPPKCRSASCPECGGQRTWKDGIRYNASGKIQRYLCRKCGYRFSKLNVKVNVTTQSGKLFHSGANLTKQMVCSGKTPLKEGLDSSFLFRSENIGSQSSRPHLITTAGKDLNSFLHYNSDYRVCASETKAAKNLVKVETRQKQAAGATKPELARIKGKIVEFVWYLKREGYSKSTIFNFGYLLRNLVNKGANLTNPESVKDAIAHQEGWSLNTKRLTVAAYHCFAKMNEIEWNPPKYKPTTKLPFISLESEIDTLIASTGKKMSCLLQLLKETGMRIGEALTLKWTDVELERYVVLLNNPEKGGNPRAFKISGKLVAMINKLPKTYEKLFGKMNYKTAGSSLIKLRKRISEKLQNPRIQRIHFHTLRHWKATIEYHKTKDILHVMKMLGHKNIQTTLIYTQLVSFEGDEFHSATAQTIEKAKKLIDAGFEYVCTHNDTMLFRKRK